MIGKEAGITVTILDKRIFGSFYVLDIVFCVCLFHLYPVMIMEWCHISIYPSHRVVLSDAVLPDCSQ